MHNAKPQQTWIQRWDTRSQSWVSILVTFTPGVEAK